MCDHHNDNFLVVKAAYSYNIILGRLTLNNLREVASTYNLKESFSQRWGVREVFGEQLLARECYV